MYCPNCGNKVSESDNFCAVCGKNLKNVHIKVEGADSKDSKSKRELSEETRVFKPISIDKIDTTDEIKNIIAEVDKKISKNIADHETGSAGLSSNKDNKKTEKIESSQDSKNSDKLAKQKKSDSKADKKVSRKSNQKTVKKEEPKISDSKDLNENFNISQKELIKRVQEELKKSNYHDEFSNEENDDYNDYNNKVLKSDTSLNKKESKPKKSSLKQMWRDFINEDDDEFSIFSSYKEKDKKHDSKEDTIDVVKSTDIDTRSFENTLNTPKITVKDIEEYEKNKEKDENSNNKSSKNKSNNAEKEIKNNAKPDKEKKSSDGFLNKFKKRDSKKDSAVSKVKTPVESKDKNKSSDKTTEVQKINFNRNGKSQDFYKTLSSITNRISLLNNDVSNYIGSLGSKNSKMVLGLGVLLTVIQIIIGQGRFNFALIIAIILKLVFDYIEFYFPLNIAIERDEIYVSDYEIKKSSLINWIICKVFLFVAFIISPFGGFFKFNLLASLTAMPFATVILIILSLLIALSQFKEEFKDRSSINFIGWYALTFILFELLFKMIWFLINFIFVTLL